MPVAIVTGGSRGLGRALVHRLATDGWSVVTDGRDAVALTTAVGGLPGARVRAVPGDVADPSHRSALVAAATDLGGLDALVLNAGALGTTPLPPVGAYPLGALVDLLNVNVVAQVGLMQSALPLLRPGGVVVAVTSDAAREAYPGWAGYGASKAALEQVASVLAVEREDLGVYVADPGDMRTDMQAAAFPGEDISDRPPPEDSVAGFLRLLTGELPSGRYEVRELDAAAGAVR